MQYINNIIANTYNYNDDYSATIHFMYVHTHIVYTMTACCNVADVK